MKNLIYIIVIGAILQSCRTRKPYVLVTPDGNRIVPTENDDTYYTPNSTSAQESSNSQTTQVIYVQTEPETKPEQPQPVQVVYVPVNMVQTNPPMTTNPPLNYNTYSYGYNPWAYQLNRYYNRNVWVYNNPYWFRGAYLTPLQWYHAQWIYRQRYPGAGFQQFNTQFGMHLRRAGAALYFMGVLL
jgi:hypothetical protein